MCVQQNGLKNVVEHERRASLPRIAVENSSRGYFHNALNYEYQHGDANMLGENGEQHVARRELLSSLFAPFYTS